ncbi:glyoxalase-like domain-containing protein [Flammula alnicola]|nr:glyoxalase-like domain-containing protein [Flammula alnicola]
MSVNTQTLDHIVHLTPPGSVEEVSRQFRELGFKVLPGGVHAGGLTENALVVFDDGVYLELISFTHPESHYPPNSPERTQRDKNPWSRKSPGWIDFAFLGNGSLSKSISEIINERARDQGNGDLYQPEQDGGRTRPDGRILKWLISAPPSDKRGILPFFCGDVTPRNLRVPSEPPSNTEHPSKAKGISFLRVLVQPSLFAEVSDEILSVIGDPPSSSTEGDTVWELNTVNKGGRLPVFNLGVPSNEEETAFLRNFASGAGIYEVGFRVEGTKRGSETTPYGRITWES